MKKVNIANVILLVLLALVIGFFSLSYVFVEAKSFSEDENRVLQTAPRFTFEKLLDGSYTRQIHEYYSDQINLRSLMVELKSVFELTIGKNENNGVLLGKDGYLIETHPYTEENYEFLQNNLSRIEKMMAKFEDEGIKVNSVLVPRKVDLMGSKFPPYYSDERNKEVWSVVNEEHFALTETLLSQVKNDVDVFYKTDHHWNALGAFYAYRALGSRVGYVPYSLSHFELESLSDEFYGTTYSSSGFFFAKPDVLLAPVIDQGRYQTHIVDIEYTFEDLYDDSYLSKKDKYSTFLSGNNAHVKITDTQDSDKETLLIIKDSFSHSLAPYLAEHYNLELIDPRYFSGSIEKYILENEFENVLFLFGLDTLASANLSIR